MFGTVHFSITANAFAVMGVFVKGDAAKRRKVAMVAREMIQDIFWGNGNAASGVKKCWGRTTVRRKREYSVFYTLHSLSLQVERGSKGHLSTFRSTGGDAKRKE